KRDNLVGLKENVILGHLVPTGTGFRDHHKTRVRKNVDLLAAAEEIGRAAKQPTFDVGGPVLRLEGHDDDQPRRAVDMGGGSCRTGAARRAAPVRPAAAAAGWGATTVRRAGALRLRFLPP